MIKKRVSVSSGPNDLKFVSGTRFAAKPCLGKSGDFEYWKVGEIR